MGRAPMLQHKHAVIFGAGGAIGSAVAEEFADEGAEVFLSGHTRASVDGVMTWIGERGGAAHAALVDALDEAAVDRYLQGVAEQTGRIDVVFNAVGPQPRDYANGTNSLDLSLEQFMLPLTTMVQSQFVTARAAARHMVGQRSGVILFLTAIPGLGASPNSVAIGTAFGAAESLLRCLSVDLGRMGVRVAGIRSSGMLETRTIQQTLENVAGAMNVTKDQATAQLVQRTLLERAPSVSDTAKAAAFLASDGARSLTGTILNASCGAAID